ncbi:MAG: exodeoxyribonuclease VII small subunit [Clostridiales bacterium]
MAKSAKVAKSFEQMMAELQQLLTEMEQGELTLEEMLNHYSAGVALIQQCRDKLQGAAERINE